MKPFDFCPACAARLDSPDGEGGAQCPSCGRSWYQSSSPAVGAAIVQDGRALVTVRAREPEKGRLDIPGGFLQPGEHPIDGLKREVKEELGVVIESSTDDCISMAVHTYGAEGDFNLALDFRARLVEGEIEAADDVAEVRWLKAEELDEADFAWPHNRDAVRKALADG
jgi:ADP-ribose pyrophosphatase YjhB (NUDIX family)